MVGYGAYGEKGEPKKNDNALEGHGEILKVEKTDMGGYVAYYTNYTSGGDSGSTLRANCQILIK